MYGIYLRSPFQNQQNVGKYTIPMDPTWSFGFVRMFLKLQDPKLLRLLQKGMEIFKISSPHSRGIGKQPNSGGEEEDFPLETGE